jgi:hypothetical protein
LSAARKATGVERFPSDYRRICQHLALARERGYSSFLIDSLQQQVLRGHQQLYRQRSRLGANALAFILADFPRLVRAEWRFVLAASLMFFGSLIGIALLVYLFPELVYNLIPADQVQRIAEHVRPRRRPSRAHRGTRGQRRLGDVRLLRDAQHRDRLSDLRQRSAVWPGQRVLSCSSTA